MGSTSSADYEFSKVLGEGAFGKVFKASSGGRNFAIKKITNTNHNAQNEAQILQNLEENQHVIKYYGHFFDESGILNIVMEFAMYGSLTDHVNDLRRKRVEKDVNQATVVLTQISLALAFLHSKRIMHRDLKPDNILITSKRDTDIVVLKVGDFGIATLVHSDVLGRYYASTMAGTEIYMAPEVIGGEKYTFSADMWSLGAIISYFWNQRHLFRSMREVINWSGQVNVLRPLQHGGVHDFTRGLLNPDPHRRPEALDIVNNYYR